MSGPNTTVGQCVNFVGSERLFMVTGSAPLTVTPDPTGLPADLSTVLRTTETYLRCSLSSDAQSFESDQKELYRFELTVTERLVMP